MSTVRLPEGTVITEGVAGTIMATVKYPTRQPDDAYMVLNDKPIIHCLQCDQDIAKDALAWIAHVRSHDRRKKVQRLGVEVRS